MAFLEGRDLWALVSSSKHWRKLSEEVALLLLLLLPPRSSLVLLLLAPLALAPLFSCLLFDRPSTRSAYACSSAHAVQQLSVWEKCYEKRYGRSVPPHLRACSWIERYLQYAASSCSCSSSFSSSTLLQHVTHACVHAVDESAMRRTGAPRTSFHSAYSRRALSGE